MIQPPTGSYPLSLHDALPILGFDAGVVLRHARAAEERRLAVVAGARVDLHSDSSCRIRSLTTISAMSDRKSTRLNSSHVSISYAVFCLKKKKNQMLIYE